MNFPIEQSEYIEPLPTTAKIDNFVYNPNYDLTLQELKDLVDNNLKGPKNK